MLYSVTAIIIQILWYYCFLSQSPSPWMANEPALRSLQWDLPFHEFFLVQNKNETIKFNLWNCRAQNTSFKYENSNSWRSIQPCFSFAVANSCSQKSESISIGETCVRSRLAYPFVSRIQKTSAITDCESESSRSLLAGWLGSHFMHAWLITKVIISTQFFGRIVYCASLNYKMVKYLRRMRARVKWNKKETYLRRARCKTMMRILLKKCVWLLQENFRLSQPPWAPAHGWIHAEFLSKIWLAHPNTTFQKYYTKIKIRRDWDGDDLEKFNPVLTKVISFESNSKQRVSGRAVQRGILFYSIWTALGAGKHARESLILVGSQE